MKHRRKLLRNKDGSSYPVIIFIIVLAVAAFVILIANEIVIPFMQLMHSTDDSIDPAFDAPRSAFASFIDLIYPKGLLLGIFICASFALLMEYHKKQYQGG